MVAIESQFNVTAFPDSIKFHGLVWDVHKVKEDLLIKELVKILIHVLVTFNTLVSTTPNTVVHVKHVNKDGLSDKIDLDAIDQDQLVIASKDSIQLQILVCNVQQAKEDL